MAYHKIKVNFYKTELVISEIIFCDIKLHYKYHKFGFYHIKKSFVWYNKFDFCDIANAFKFYDNTKWNLWYHRIEFAISKICLVI